MGHSEQWTESKTHQNPLQQKHQSQQVLGMPPHPNFLWKPLDLPGLQAVHPLMRHRAHQARRADLRADLHPHLLQKLQLLQDLLAPRLAGLQALLLLKRRRPQQALKAGHLAALHLKLRKQPSLLKKLKRRQPILTKNKQLSLIHI